MHPIIKNILYGLGVFAIFITIALMLKLFTHRLPDNPDYFGLFKNSDLVLGLVVAVVVTINHNRKKIDKK